MILHTNARAFLLLKQGRYILYCPVCITLSVPACPYCPVHVQGRTCFARGLGGMGLRKPTREVFPLHSSEEHLISRHYSRHESISPVMLLPDHHRNSPPQTMTKSPSRTFIRDRLLLGITPITHDFYNQWARSPKPPDVNTSDTGNSDSGVNETRVKTSAPRPAARMPGSRTDLKSANPRVGSCRSNTPSLNIELPPMPVLRRAVTVVGNERMGSVCSERGSSVLLPKKVLPSSQILPMNQAVFLFKGDSFIQNAPFLGDPNRGRSGSRLSTYYSSPNQRLPSNKTPSRVTLKGELRGSNTGPVQVAKVQFIDFSDEKSYIASRREDTKDKDTPKDKQFLPLSIPLGVSVS